jgi:hypothetical protein
MLRTASAPLLICAIVTFAGPALSMTEAIERPRTDFAPSEKKILMAHKRDFRHCHNIHVRTYCHKTDRLPVNWPPHSDTPAR